MTSELEQTALPAPDEPPGQAPDGGPRWPVWYGPLGFVLAFVVGQIVAAVVLAIAGVDPDRDKTTYEVLGTLFLDMALVGTAVVLASRVRRARPWHFGLRATPLRSTLSTAGLGALSFIIFVRIYVLLFNPAGKQDVVQKLGGDKGGFAVVAAAFVVIAVAPAAEEIFFRGFFYRALRSRLGVAAAVAVDGLLFAAIHYTGPKTLDLLPVLGALAVMFCLVFEYTGSIFPTIAMHAINNSLAFGSTVHHGDAAAAGFGGGVVALCLVLPGVVPALRAPALR